MRALEKAADDGVDLVSCSWGGPWWFAETDPFSLIMSGLAARGIAPVVAVSANYRQIQGQKCWYLGHGGVYVLINLAALLKDLVLDLSFAHNY